MSNFWKFHHKISGTDCPGEYINSYNILCQVTLGRKESTLPQSAYRLVSASCIMTPQSFSSSWLCEYIATFSYGYVVLAAQWPYRRHTKTTGYCCFETNEVKKGDKTYWKMYIIWNVLPCISEMRTAKASCGPASLCVSADNLVNFHMVSIP